MIVYKLILEYFYYDDIWVEECKIILVDIFINSLTSIFNNNNTNEEYDKGIKCLIIINKYNYII